jgi:hypothetical protein
MDKKMLPIVGQPGMILPMFHEHRFVAEALFFCIDQKNILGNDSISDE